MLTTYDKSSLHSEYNVMNFFANKRASWNPSATNLKICLKVCGYILANFQKFKLTLFHISMQNQEQP